MYLGFFLSLSVSFLFSYFSVMKNSQGFCLNFINQNGRTLPGGTHKRHVAKWFWLAFWGEAKHTCCESTQLSPKETEDGLDHLKFESAFVTLSRYGQNFYCFFFFFFLPKGELLNDLNILAEILYID